jgi:hypothetical protein
MKSALLSQLQELQALRGNPLIVYSSTINGDSVDRLYECLRQMGTTPHLDLVLSTTGGVVTVARRLALLLHEYTQHLTILVPYYARSAGTLLCLSANELVMGQMAELGPIDAHMSPSAAPPSDAPPTISAEDIRTFRLMAEDWFGVKRKKDRLQVLALVAQRVFPTSLSSFYRSERLTRLAAQELLRYQLPDAEESVHKRIVDQLVGGYDAHDHIITRNEARTLGLQVRFASDSEEALMWNMVKTRRKFSDPRLQAGDERLIGLVMSAHYCARQVQTWHDASEVQQREIAWQSTGNSPQQKIPSITWKVDED